MSQRLSEQTAISAPKRPSGGARDLIPLHRSASPNGSGRELENQSRRSYDEFSLERDSFTATALEEIYNRSFHAGMSRITQGLSPAALAQARQDWLLHLASAPGK